MEDINKYYDDFIKSISEYVAFKVKYDQFG